MNYLTLLNRTIDLYLEGKLQEAYDLITNNQKEIKGVDAQLYNFRYAIASKMHKKELALKILKEAVIEKDYWYSKEILLDDDDLEILRNDDLFRKIVQQSHEKELKAKNSSDYIYEKINDNFDELLLILHGNQLNNEMAKSEWYFESIDLAYGFLQSNVIEFSNGYSWEDFDLGSKKIKEIYKGEQEKNKNIYLGGFSAGAGVVLNSVIKTEIAPKGIFLFAPWLPTIDEEINLLNKLKEKNIKVFIVIGDQDNDCLKTTKKLTNILDDQKINYKFKLIKNLKHEYPENFEQYIKEAIKYFKK